MLPITRNRQSLMNTSSIKKLSRDFQLILPLILDWSGWENKTQCVANQQPCGKGTIYRKRNCTANDTEYPNDQAECEKRYPGETANETIDCFVPCYGNYAYSFISLAFMS